MGSTKLAVKIRELREEKSWSQAQLAEISSLSIRTVQRIEHNGACSKETLLALASAFNIDVKELTQILFHETNNSDIHFIMNADPAKASLTGIFLILPAIYFASSAILKYAFSVDIFFDVFLIFYANEAILSVWNIISPIIFFGGLLTAIIINFVSIIGFKVERSNALIKSEVFFKPVVLNLLVITISVVFMVMMISYLFVENFTLR